MKIKKLIALTVIIVLCLSFVMVYVHSENEEKGYLELISFGYYDENGDPVEQFSGGNPVYVTAKIKRGNETLKSASLIAQLYVDGEVSDIYSDKYDFKELSEEKELKCTVPVPLDTTRVELKCFIWDNFKNMNYLTNTAKFKSDNADIENISIYGVDLEGFSPDTTAYSNIILPASASNHPKVQYITGDIGTKVETVFEDGKIILNAKSHGGVEKSYNIEYSKKPFAVNDIVLVNPNDSSNVFETSLLSSPLKLPEFDKDKDGNPIPTLFGSSVFNKATRAFADKYHFYMSMPEEMLGARVVSTRRDTFGSEVEYKVKFTLNKTATFYFNTLTQIPTGAVKIGQIGYREKNTYSEAVAYTYDPADKGNVLRDIYKIECVVPEGESKTFEFDLKSYSWTGPMLFIKESL